MYPVLEVVQHLQLPLCEYRGSEDKVFLQTVNEWGWKLLVNSLLFCYHNQPGRLENIGEKSQVSCE